jgi:serine/threonine-protein kinase
VDGKLPGYRITKQIGIGAASKISLAVELKTGKTFAVKHVVRNSADDDPFIAQVEREYEVSSKLNHRNLRHSYYLHRVRRMLQTKELMIVMEYVDGLDLERARPNRLNTFLSVFRRVAAGLRAMHEAGYVHSDIKPTNIMIGKGGVVKIIDFGQSCPLYHRKERIQGTPDYIAPEQVRRMLLDQRTDVFNLGATMYWVLTSDTYPTEIRGADVRGGVSVLSHDSPVAPAEINDKIPLSLSKLVMECCRDNPADRPADMKQVDARLAVAQKVWRRQRLAAWDQLKTDQPPVDNNAASATEDT